MVEPPDSPDSRKPTVSFPETVNTLKIDPKLYPKALRKLQGLVKGNGFDETKITLCDAPEDTSVTMYRFKARTAMKLVPQYGIRVEAGRNTTCEAMASESEFKKAIAQISIDARTTPEKRQHIIDFMFARTDKGFGITEQRTKFHTLNRNFVQHEKCTTCSNTGKCVCAKCHGKTLMPCTKCQGRKQVLCPRCKGSGHIRNNNGKTIPCTFCRADGRVNCNLCGARGQIKCQGCAATGAISCRICAGSGWMSHIAHIEIYAQILFTFERENLPPLLVQSLEKNPSRCVEKHDIEVSIVPPKMMPHHASELGKTSHDVATDYEPDDTIWIDYEAICPFGPISFMMDDQKIFGSLFGFQTCLLNFPFFMDKLIEDGKTALIAASTNRKQARANLLKAAEFRMISDIIAQTLWHKNIIKTKNFLIEKYSTGTNPETIRSLVDATDLTLRNVTRIGRYIGLVIGWVLFAVLLEYFYLSGGRYVLGGLGIPEIALSIIDFAFIPLGMALSILSAKFSAKWSQNKALDKIVPADILKKTLPKAGKTIYWSGFITIITLIIFWGLTIWEGMPAPVWLNHLIILIHGAFPVG